MFITGEEEKVVRACYDAYNNRLYPSSRLVDRKEYAVFEMDFLKGTIDRLCMQNPLAKDALEELLSYIPRR